MSGYDTIAHIYDPWSVTVVEDIQFYVDEAVRSGGPVVELCVGTGRVAIPIAAAGIEVIGVDSSEGMLAQARGSAEAAGVELDLRFGDLRDPPVEGEYPLVIIPFRSLLHMETYDDRRAALRAARKLLAPGGRFIFDVFAPDDDDIAETQGRWLEREPDIFEMAVWDETAQTLTLHVRGPNASAQFMLAWLDAGQWQALLTVEGFEVEALYGDFDHTPWVGQEDLVFVCRRSD